MTITNGPRTQHTITHSKLGTITFFSHTQWMTIQPGNHRHSVLLFTDSEGEFLGEVDTDMGGGLGGFGVDLESEEVLYIELENTIFKVMNDIYPYFFSKDSVNLFTKIRR